jgi:predicted  nucleic acid-binding Zn-ribbon protein
MTDEPDNLVLEHLRAIRADARETRVDMREIKGRVTNLEIVVDALATAHGQMQQSIDRLSDRIERIETPLGLVEAE